MAAMQIDAARRSVSLDPVDPEFFNNPYPFYDEIRDRVPAFKWEHYGHWCFSRFEDVNALLRDRRFGRQILHVATLEELGWPETPEHVKPFYAFERHSLLELEPPVHTRLRGLVNRSFLSRQVERLRPAITSLCNGLLDQLEGSHEADLLASYATPIPVIVICDLLGVPGEMAQQLLAWSHDMVAMYMARRDRAVEDAAVKATVAFSDFMRGYIKERRTSPRDDLLSELIRAEEQGQKLSEDELVTTAILLLNAGHEATVHTTGNAVKTILESGLDPATLFANDAQTEATVEEWGAAVLAAARYEEGSRHQVTHRLDGVLLHPVWGFATFLVVMFAFFQTVFAVAAPMQDAIGAGFGWLGGQVHAHVGNQLIASVLADAMLGGVGSVLVFVPQVALLFLLIGLLENVGYLPRAAYLMDRLMSLTGLDGRAFVAMLSSVACAVPGIMATRTIPSPRDRLATMLAAPLMTCSARLPVYVLLVGLLVDDRPRWGPVSAAGAAMFVLYVAGALSAMIAARVLRSTVLRGGLLPFSMDLPPYRMPSARTVLVSAWGSVRMFLRKAGTIILVSTLVLWVLLNVPFRAAETAGMGHVEAAQYVAEHSVAGSIGRAVEPAFEPLGFDWRIDLGLLGAMSAREVFVSTMGQVAAAADPADPAGALAGLRHGDGPRAGQRVLDGPTVIALLAWFVYALQCTSTIAVIRRESNSWRWPALAFGYLCALAWVMAFLARQVALALGVT